MKDKLSKKKTLLEFELDPIIQLAEDIGNKSIGSIFKGVPDSEKERAKQKDGIISQKGDYQIIKKKGHYYGIIPGK